VENTDLSKKLCPGYLIVLGIKKLPKKINRNGDNFKKKSNIKIFFKALNKNHILPTRYFVDLNTEQQSLIVNTSSDIFTLKSDKKTSNENCKEANWQISNVLVDKYFSGKYKWFFKKLNF
jgi:large subunit ribosomal protein L27e